MCSLSCPRVVAPYYDGPKTKCRNSNYGLEIFYMP